MKSKVVAKRFFSSQEYENLKFKTLSLKDYQSFIELVHTRIAKEKVAESKEGWEMPLNLGKLEIRKNLNLRGVKNKVTGEVYQNSHSMGYVFSCRHFCKNRRVKFNPKFNIQEGIRESTKEVPFLYYKFNPHRKNIKRYITALVRKGKLDYKLAD